MGVPKSYLFSRNTKSTDLPALLMMVYCVADSQQSSHEWKFQLDRIIEAIQDYQSFDCILLQGCYG